MACNECLRDDTCNPEILDMLQEVFGPMCDYGKKVTFHHRMEAEIGRDDFHSINWWKDGTEFDTWALPINFSPNEKEIQAAGLREIHEGMFTTSAWHMEQQGFSFDDIDLIRWSVEIDGNFYLLREKGLDTPVADAWLFYTFGIARL